MYVTLAFICGTPMLPAQKKKNAYINNDSTAIFSTHSSRPFKYGYALDRMECRQHYNHHLIHFGIRNGETVADIGGASGWLSGILSVYTDSVTYYVQDLDTVFLNSREFQKMQEHYNRVRGDVQTNQFRFIIGKESASGLPDTRFDLIFISNAFHEFTHPQEMLQDLKAKLKPQGRLIIFDQFSSDYAAVIHDGCEKNAYTLETLCQMTASAGFTLTRLEYPPGCLLNYAEFRQNVSGSVVPYRLDPTDSICLQMSAELFSDGSEEDTSYYGDAARYFIRSVNWDPIKYPAYETYFNRAAQYGYNSGDYRKAWGFYYLNTLLYPRSTEAALELGDFLLDKGDYSGAFTKYQKAWMLTENGYEAPDPKLPALISADEQVR